MHNNANASHLHRWKANFLCQIGALQADPLLRMVPCEIIMHHRFCLKAHSGPSFLQCDMLSLPCASWIPKSRDGSLAACSEGMSFGFRSTESSN